MNETTALFHEIHKVVTGLDPVVPSTTTPRYVSMKNYSKLAIIIGVKNATTVTGSAITLVQAKAVAGTGAKALAFTTMMANIDTAAGDTDTETAVISNTFTTDATNSKNLKYIINVDSSMLDVANGFNCVRLGTGDATAATVSALYILYPVTGNPAPSAIIN